jgi:hypothetical protein
MDYYYCFVCKTYFKSDKNICTQCGRGTAKARRKLYKSTPSVDTYRIYVDGVLVGNQRVEKTVS